MIGFAESRCRSMWLGGIALVGVMVGAAVPHTASILPTAQSADRQIVVIGDLHLGPGKEPGTDAWHAIEDFRWDDEFEAFLDAVDREGGGATDLVLNGDTFELWQSTEADCRGGGDTRLGCTEQEAMGRLERVLSGHPSEVSALARFAATGSNRVILVPGDHDAALLWPRVGDHARAALASAGGRVDVAVDGDWLSADSRIYAEHGHQIGDSAGRFDRWPRPFLQERDTEYLERTFEERLVQAFFNVYEATYPILDNVAEQGRGLRYGLSVEGFPEQPAELSDLMRYFLLKMSWQQFRSNLESEQQAPRWDMAKVREQGDRFLAESLPTDDPLQPRVAAAIAGGEFPYRLSDLTDDQISAICDYRASIRRSRRRLEQTLTQLGPIAGPPPRECPRDPETRGGAFGYFFRARDLALTQHAANVAERLRAAGRLSDSFAVLVVSHSHLSYRPFSPRDGGLTVVHTGAWQRVVAPADLEALSDEREGSESDVLQRLRPEDLAPCYSFVAVPPYDAEPRPELRAWSLATDGTWAITSGC